MTLQLIVEAGSQAGRTIDLHEGENVVGRSAEAEIRLGGADVSRKHLVIRVSGGEAVAENLSRFGTRLDTERMDAPTTLEDGQRLMLGFDTVLRFSKQTGNDSAEEPQTGGGVGPAEPPPPAPEAAPPPAPAPEPPPAPAGETPSAPPAPVAPTPAPPSPAAVARSPAPPVPPIPSDKPPAPARPAAAPPEAAAARRGDLFVASGLSEPQGGPTGDEAEPLSGHIDFRVAPEDLDEVEEPLSMAAIGAERFVHAPPPESSPTPAAAQPSAPLRSTPPGAAQPLRSAPAAARAAPAEDAEEAEDDEGPHTRMMSVDAVQYLRERQEKQARARVLWIALGIAGLILLALLIIWRI